MKPSEKQTLETNYVSESTVLQEQKMVLLPLH